MPTFASLALTVAFLLSCLAPAPAAAQSGVEWIHIVNASAGGAGASAQRALSLKVNRK